MSREVTGTPPREDARSGRWTALRLVAGALAATALVGLALATLRPAGSRPAAAPSPSATPPTGGLASPASSDAASPAASPAAVPARYGSGLLGQVVAAGRDGADLTNVQVTVVVRNTAPTPRTVIGVTLVGLGTAYVEDTGVVELAPGGALRVGASVAADCAALLRRSVHLVISERTAQDTPLEEEVALGPVDATLRVLDPLCPPVVSGLAVTISATRPDDDGSVVLRLVNHGVVSALVVPRVGPDARGVTLSTDPAQPFDLVPGEAVVTRVRLVVACPAPDPATATPEIGLEARMPFGYAAVTGWPTAVARAALDAAGRRCA